MNKTLSDVIKTGRTTVMPILGRVAKLQSEAGKFAEAVLIEQGHLPHKTLSESSFGEAADVIICVLDSLAAGYPEISPEWVVEHLHNHIEIKHNKWKRILKKHYE